MNPPEPQTPRAPRKPPRRAKQSQARPTLRHRFQNRLAVARPHMVLDSARRVRWDGMALMAGCLLLLYAFGMNDLFYVGRVEVDGNRLAATDTIIAKAGIRNYSVFFLQYSEIERQVRELSGVRDADAWLEFPNTVHIRVSERMPVVAWDNGRGTVWADEAGALYAQGAIPPELVVVRDLDGATRTRLDVKLIGAIKAVNTALPSIRRMEYSDARGLAFNEEHGWKVLFGEATQINAKLAMLQSLSAHLLAQKIDPEYVDVRLPDRAFYKAR
ncbi:MAG: FtsQ-type POTRA domain-containing protein [Chloroflexi bacterium]|nr:FtsQ-type POTRA domain-containing protein [Chloroflexota bacterium]